MCSRTPALLKTGLRHGMRCCAGGESFPGHTLLAFMSTCAVAESSVVIPTNLDVGSTSYRTNYDSMGELLHILQEKTRAVLLGGGRDAVIRHHGRGKLLPRERIDRLLDPASPFLELSMLAGNELYPEAELPGGGLVTGLGRISGRLCMMVANDSTVKGGTYFPITVKKHLRAQEIAQHCALPTLYLVDSGGANLPRQAEVFPDRDHFGRIFFNQAQMSRSGLPQIALVLGSCTAGGAYIPAMADESVIVHKNGSIFLAGPPLVKEATGEVVSVEELGGGLLHSRKSGVTDHLAANEEQALEIGRRIVATLPPPPPPAFGPTPQPWREPLYPTEDLRGLPPADGRNQFDVREVIARIADGSEMTEFKRLYGTSLVTGFILIHGTRVGVIANNGVLFAESALKGTHFIQLCSQRAIPLLFLQNISGFMVGKVAESGGIAKAGAKMVMALACATVPKITVVVGGSFGAGNYGMCGRAFSPAFLFMWPSARVGVMGGRQAGGVLGQVEREKRRRAGEEWPAEEEERFRERVTEQYEHEASPFFSSTRLWDDGVIDPKDTREVVSLCLRAALTTPPAPTPNYGIFRM